MSSLLSRSVNLLKNEGFLKKNFAGFFLFVLKSKFDTTIEFFLDVEGELILRFFKLTKLTFLLWNNIIN